MTNPLGKLREKMASTIQGYMNPKELLKHLCPFQLDIKIAVLANVYLEGKKHDYAILLHMEDEDKLFEDPKDLETFIAQMLAAKDIKDPKIATATVRHAGKEWTTIFLDFEKPHKHSQRVKR